LKAAGCDLDDTLFVDGAASTSRMKRSHSEGARRTGTPNYEEAEFQKIVWQPGNVGEELEGLDNKRIVAFVIRAAHAQVDPSETAEARDSKRPHNQAMAHVAVVLAPVDSRPRSPII
jgi:hypothetical protein